MDKRFKKKNKNGCEIESEIEIGLLTLGHRTVESSFTMTIMWRTVFTHLSVFVGTVERLCIKSQQASKKHVQGNFKFCSSILLELDEVNVKLLSAAHLPPCTAMAL